jgi:hypothetical protein
MHLNFLLLTLQKAERIPLAVTLHGMPERLPGN